VAGYGKIQGQKKNQSERGEIETVTRREKRGEGSKNWGEEGIRMQSKKKGRYSLPKQKTGGWLRLSEKLGLGGLRGMVRGAREPGKARLSRQRKL